MAQLVSVRMPGTSGTGCGCGCKGKPGGCGGQRSFAGLSGAAQQGAHFQRVSGFLIVGVMMFAGLALVQALGGKR